MGITTLKSKIQDFQQPEETRSREVEADALTTNYMTGAKFRLYSSGRIVGDATVRSNKTTLVKGSLYKEASGNKK